MTVPAREARLQNVRPGNRRKGRNGYNRAKEKGKAQNKRTDWGRRRHGLGKRRGANGKMTSLKDQGEPQSKALQPRLATARRFCFLRPSFCNEGWLGQLGVSRKRTGVGHGATNTTS
eukprot:4534609-Pleurochrysis_carterae.AAC.6